MFFKRETVSRFIFCSFKSIIFVNFLLNHAYLFYNLAKCVIIISKHCAFVLIITALTFVKYQLEGTVKYG